MAKTSCKMVNQKLSIDFKRMEKMLHVVSFRANCIDLEVVEGEACATQNADSKNDFVRGLLRE